ncbi:hypothetical protein AEGHOMDF_5986 [Methylobacterium soli]|nr:hypothetical protein AEGHOMDF_5986 [Methylobacterium soli]
MALGEMQHDGARLEQGEVALLIGRDLPEGMKGPVRGLLHRREGEQTNAVGLAHFRERPSDGHVPRQASAAIRRLREGGQGRNHAAAPVQGVRDACKALVLP